MSPCFRVVAGTIRTPGPPVGCARVVSRGDLVRLPVTLSNETSRPYQVALSTRFGSAFRVRGGIPASLSMAGGERKSFFAELQVVGDGKDPEESSSQPRMRYVSLMSMGSRNRSPFPTAAPSPPAPFFCFTRTACCMAGLPRGLLG